MPDWPPSPKMVTNQLPLLAVEGVGAVVLRPAHDVIQRVLRVDREALVLERPQTAFIDEIVVGTFEQPVLAVDQVGAR